MRIINTFCWTRLWLWVLGWMLQHSRMQYFKGTLNFLKENHESNSEHVLSQCLSTNYNSLSCSQPFQEKFVSIKPIKIRKELLMMKGTLPIKLSQIFTEASARLCILCSVRVYWINWIALCLFCFLLDILTDSVACPGVWQSSDIRCSLHITSSPQPPPIPNYAPSTINYNNTSST